MIIFQRTGYRYDLDRYTFIKSEIDTEFMYECYIVCNIGE